MYKTILVDVDGSPQQESRVRAAAVVAQAQGSHLIGCNSTGITWLDLSLSAGSMNAPSPLVDFEALRARGARLLEEFALQAEQLGVASVETRLEDDLPDISLALQARYADLVVLSQDPDAASDHWPRRRNLPEQLAVHCPRPILVVPPGYHSAPIAKTIVAGWDGRIQAMRALAAALPLLSTAENVKLALINPDQLSALHGEEAGADMALYLARHAVEAEVVLERTAAAPAEALMTLAGQNGAGLIVAGAYGHSRYREWVLGGTTRALLSQAQIPLLLAH
ncbi:nucleotide-binding universal stress UspA family protein [Massilia sp. UYP11]|uniref:universal stress protein n=1 Tax=Massilia sp. UYP11 TaxID=1756385 RepID=UPI003D1E7FCC